MENDIINEVLAEDCRRIMAKTAPYDPVTGNLSPGRRFSFFCPELHPTPIRLPEAMRRLPQVEALERGRRLTEVFPGTEENARLRWCRLRCEHDFPFWAYKFVRIKPKGGIDGCPFVLNNPQRHLIGEFEKMREAGEPIRLILVKARQWGGSTATQTYMLWIQLMRRKGFNSLIVAQQHAGTDEVLDIAKTALDSYPGYMLADEGEEISAKEKRYVSNGISNAAIRIPRRCFKIKAGSAERPDSSRGGDYALVHLTEVGLWKQTDGKTPEDIIRAATSGVLLEPETMIVMESTANGTGTYFHREYEAAKRGSSLYRPLFIPWFEIERYSIPIADREAFARRLVEGRHENFTDDDRKATGEYLWNLWLAGATLEAIAWYEKLRAGYNNHDHLMAEYPSSDLEAFVSSGANVFQRDKALELRKECRPPRKTGELLGHAESGAAALSGICFHDDPRGRLKVWDEPDTDGAGRARRISDRYLVVVDVGGRSMKADWSVIAVFDRLGMATGGKPAIAAQWRGHCDMDQLAWLSARIARWYGEALLVIESNTIETRDPERYVDGDQSLFILNQLRSVYGNLYARRQSPEDIVEGRPRKYGFHTNISTKPMIISNLVRVVREGLYTERDEACIDEFLTYQRRPNGSYGAVSGKHDDLLMTRAIGLHICLNEMAYPRLAEEYGGNAAPAAALMRRATQLSLF